MSSQLKGWDTEPKEILVSLAFPRFAPAPRARLAAAVAAAAGSLVVSLAAVPTADAATWTPPALPANPDTSADPDVPLRVRVASFNVLGWSHTPPKGPRKKFADGVTRTKLAARIIREQQLEIVGLQEFQVPQFEEWKRQFGSSYGLWPGNALRATPMQNSIGYDTTKWEVVRKKTFPVPYFHGKPIAMPYVLFRHRETGRLLWVINTHNPANVVRGATKHRNQGFQMEIDLVRHLERHSPGVPIISLGDKNDRSNYLCQMMAATSMRSASGGGISDGKCVTPRGMLVDWVLGNAQVNFSGYQGLRSPLVKRATDHPVVIADALVQSDQVATSGIRQVVTLNVQGLSGRALNPSSSVPIPAIRRLAASGASTNNARILPDGASPLGNALGIVSGRPAAKRNGGTGIGTRADRGGTVHRSAGAYVSSAFSTISDTGRRTALWSSDAGWYARARASWNAKSGVADRVGIDNGRNKIRARALLRTDRGVINRLIKDLRQRRTPYSSVTLSAADEAARRYGPRSQQYRRAIRAIDSYIWKLVKAINSDPRLGRRTVLIITSDHGATKSKYIRTRYLNASTVPFVVWGATVRRGSDLYALNPHLANPGRDRPDYTAERQPVRNADAANLATKLLGLPPVPNGRIGADQRLTVF